MIQITRPELPPFEDYAELLREVWRTRMLSNFGTMATRLERVASDYLGSPHVLAVSSGDVGLIVALAALQLPEGSPCFLSDFTFNSTINAALWNRLRPVLVDIDPSTFNMSTEALREAMERHPEPGVVLPTHVFGNPCDHASLGSAARDHSSYLVFDAAHAYGSSREGRRVGTFGDAEVFSLSGTKPVTSAEGGLISTARDDLAERIRYLRAYGFQDDYRSRFLGINGKLSELHSALGVLTLPRVDEIVLRRNEIGAAYRRALGDLVGWQSVGSQDRSTYKDVAVLLGERRSAVERALRAEGIETKRYFVPLHHMEIYSVYASSPLSTTEEIYASVLCIPAYAGMDDGVVEMVSDVMRSVLAASEVTS